MSKKPKSEKLVLLMERGPNGSLVPLTQMDREAIESCKFGVTIQVTIDQEKNAAQVRLWHAICSHLAKAMGQPQIAVEWYIKGKVGAIREFAAFDGVVQMVPVSVTDMGGPEFAEFFNRVEEFVTTEMIPGSELKDIAKGLWDHARVLTP